MMYSTVKISLEGERDETVPVWEERVQRVQGTCTGDLDTDDDDVTVDYVEEGSLVFWTKANASTVKSKRKFAESMDRFMGNLIDKCPIDTVEEAKLSIKVDVVESSEDEDTDDDEESNLYICGRCKVIFKSFSSFTNHKRNCNLRRTKISKDQHNVDDEHDDSSKGQKRKVKDIVESELQLFSQESSALSDTTESEEHAFASSSSLSSRKEYVVDRLKASFKNSCTDTTSGYETDKERKGQKNIQHVRVKKETSKHSSMLKDNNTFTDDEDEGFVKSAKQPLDYRSTKYMSAKQRRTLKKLKKRSTSDSSDKSFDNKHILEINVEWNDEEYYSHYDNQSSYSSDEHHEDSSVIDSNDEVCSESGNISAQNTKGNEKQKAEENKYKTELETKCNDDPEQFRKGTLEIRSSHEAICTLEKPFNGVETVEISGRSKCGKAFTDDEVVVQIYQIEGRTTYIPRIGKEIQVPDLFGEVIGCLKRHRYNEINHPVFVCELDKFEYDKAKPICRTLPKFHLLSENKEDSPFSVDIYRYNENTRSIFYDKSLPVSPALRQRYLFYVAYISWNSLYPLGAIIKVHESTKVFETGLKILKLQNSVPTLYSNETIKYVDFDMKYMGDKSKRIDLTEECYVFTIDPVGSKVLDDAVSIKKLHNGEWRVGVHITDVSVFIEQNSALDYEARERGTTFFRGQFGDPIKCFPNPLVHKDVV
ncbi:unnamed protein product [Mytilus edulis]|uniref:Uncharacterized protein n=1 Tax=Mytilus edulis TaxID=6550 RepID=A0A8S3S4X4_MYTED|nr:unnamed protein product [Mytilus edulis]